MSGLAANRVLLATQTQFATSTSAPSDSSWKIHIRRSEPPATRRSRGTLEGVFPWCRWPVVRFGELQPASKPIERNPINPPGGRRAVVAQRRGNAEKSERRLPDPCPLDLSGSPTFRKAASSCPRDGNHAAPGVQVHGIAAISNLEWLNAHYHPHREEICCSPTPRSTACRGDPGCSIAGVHRLDRDCLARGARLSEPGPAGRGPHPLAPYARPSASKVRLPIVLSRPLADITTTHRASYAASARMSSTALRPPRPMIQTHLSFPSGPQSLIRAGLRLRAMRSARPLGSPASLQFSGPRRGRRSEIVLEGAFKPQKNRQTELRLAR